MKKSILTLTLLLTSVFAVQAQQVLTQDIQVNASVISKLAVVSSQDVEIGTVITAEPSVLPANANDAVPVTNAGVNSSAGLIEISGAPGISITVDYTDATLVNGNGTSAQFSPSVYNDATQITSGTDVNFVTSNLTFDIGGSLDAVADGDEGDYSTTNPGGSPITFTFTYVI